MNLLTNTAYKVKPNHKFHANRIGRFEFLGGPKKDVIVLSDINFRNRLFCVGLRDLMDFNPNVDEVIILAVPNAM